MRAINKIPVLGITTLLSFIAFALLVTFPKAFEYWTVTTARLPVATYDRKARDRFVFERDERDDFSSAAAAKVLDPRNLRVREIDIGMSIRPSSGDGFGDVFATGPLDEGVRLEYSRPSTLTLIVGSHSPPGHTRTVIAQDVVPNRWHVFHMTIDRYGAIAVDVDGLNRISATLSDISFLISKVTIGAGFPNGRAFPGQIDDAKISYGIYEQIPHGDDLAIDLAALSALIFTISLYFWVGPESWSKLRWSWNGRPPWLGGPARMRTRTGVAESNEEPEGRSGVIYRWPLPDDAAAVLALDSSSVSLRGINGLATNLVDLDRPQTNIAYTWRLTDGVEAELRFVGPRPPTKRAMKKLIDYLCDLASFHGR